MRDHLQRFVRRQPARREVPRFPVRAQPLQLAVAAEPGAAARVHDVGDALGDQRVAVLLGQEPLRPPPHHAVEQLPRHPLAQLRVVGRVLVLEPVVLASTARRTPPGSSACRTSWSSRRTRHVLVERRDREAVLLARVAVGHLRQVQLEIERAFDGRRDAVLLARLDDPLADDAVAGDVLLERVGRVRLLVALDEAERGVAILDARSGRTRRARSRRCAARASCRRPPCRRRRTRPASTSADRASSSRRRRGWRGTARPRSDAGRAAPTCASARRRGPA